MDTPLFRVLKGTPTDAELAALTLLLLTRAHRGANRCQPAAPKHRPVPGWRRTDRGTGFTGALTWLNGTLDRVGAMR